MCKNILYRKSGFSLLEVTVVIIILTILASAVIPVLSRQNLEKAAQKTALEISVIEDASRAYYIANNQWPTPNLVYTTSIAVLQASNFLPSTTAWSGINPFGASAATPSTYAYTATPSGSLMTVSTYVPSDALPIVQSLLPTTQVSGNTISSSIPIPGASTDAFGPLNCSVGNSGTAATDGYIMANSVFHGSNLYIYGYINGIQVTSNSCISSSGGDTRYAGLTLAVAKGDTWQVAVNGGSLSVCWRPHG